MSFGPDAVAKGDREEHATMAKLATYGWGCVPFGQGVWNPDTSPVGNRAVIDGVRRTTRWPIRWAPDLLACHAARGPVFVEVTCNDRGTGRRAVEVSKLAADDAWSAIAPVVFVDVHDWTAWVHTPVRWAAYARPGPPTGNGSGDAYALFPTSDQRPLVDLFGVPG